MNFIYLSKVYYYKDDYQDIDRIMNNENMNGSRNKKLFKNINALESEKKGNSLFKKKIKISKILF